MSVLKVYSDRSDLAGERRAGRLWHFGHFMHDFLLPMNDWRLARKPDLSRTTLYMCNTPDQSVGSFHGVVEEFLQTELKLVPPDEFEKVPGQELKLKPYLFGPYSGKTCANMLSTARQRFDLDLSEKPAFDVILIERGVAELGFDHDAGLKDWARANGSQRRFILNHAELADYLAGRYGDRFCNVVLEEMTFEDQVRLFFGARLVLGQHGAGLNHLLWMSRPGSAVVELGKPLTPPFINMCKAKKLRYVNLQGVEGLPTLGRKRWGPRLGKARCRALNVSLQKLEHLLDALESTREDLD